MTAAEAGQTTTPDEQQGDRSRGIWAFIKGDIQTELLELHAEIESDLVELQHGTTRLANIQTQIESGEHAVIKAALREIIAEDTGARRKLQDRQARPKLDVVHSNYSVLEAVAEARIPAWLYGEAGSGKSTAGEGIADQHSLDFRSISLCPTTTKSDILGYRDATGQYRSSGFRDTYENGGVFLFDEIDNSHPSSLAVINHALANGSAEFPDGHIEIHPDTIIIAGANTIGKGANAQYVGRAVIDGATRDRFAFIPWDIDDDLEESLALQQDLDDGTVDISKGGTPSPKGWLETVRAFRSAIAESGIKQICSPRATLYGIKLAEIGMGQMWLEEILIYKGMSQSDRTKIGSRLSSSGDH